uniref:Uncharacterized protein n=1 Tax=viral metagenome TaxID=1070528 RepID=A0A6M3L695_9ZZZZ
MPVNMKPNWQSKLWEESMNEIRKMLREIELRGLYGKKQTSIKQDDK